MGEIEEAIREANDELYFLADILTWMHTQKGWNLMGYDESRHQYIPVMQDIRVTLAEFYKWQADNAK